MLAHDQANGTDLLGTVRHYLAAAGHKSVTARRSHPSRQALYQRLRLIEQILGADLESGDVRTQLHVAVTALNAQRSATP